MRIALLTDGITPYVTGGMQRHSHHLARHLLKLGVELTLVYTVPHGAEVPHQEEVRKLLGAEPGKFRSVFIPFPVAKRVAGLFIPGHYIRESYQYSCQIYTTLQDEWGSFDFIYAKGYTAWCLLEHRKKGVHTSPVGLKFHGYEMYQKAGSLREKLAHFMLRPSVVFNNREASVVFSYGGEITRIIERMGVEPHKIAEIPSGIDDSWLAEHPLPQNGIRRFLFMGRDEPRKGIADLMRCRQTIAALPIEFHWVGPIAKSRRLDLPNCIYHGEVRDLEQLRSIIDQCQVLVAPSHAEGMPNVILEAMARGLAVIATPVGAVPSLVSAATGMLVEPRRIKPLAQALEAFARLEEQQLYQMRQAALSHVREHFLWSVIARRTLDAIVQLTHTPAEYSDAGAKSF